MRRFSGALTVDKIMTAIKILLALAMMFGGVSTALSPAAPADGALGTLFGYHAVLGLFGMAFFVSGALIIYGMYAKRKRVVGFGLAATYLLSFFVFILEVVVFQSWTYWIDELIIAILAAGAWLWWKFKTEYLNIEEIRRLRQELFLDDH